jgi:hypothetical protein
MRFSSLDEDLINTLRNESELEFHEITASIPGMLSGAGEAYTPIWHKAIVLNFNPMSHVARPWLRMEIRPKTC